MLCTKRCCSAAAACDEVVFLVSTASTASYQARETSWYRLPAAAEGRAVTPLRQICSTVENHGFAARISGSLYRSGMVGGAAYLTARRRCSSGPDRKLTSVAASRG